MDDTYKENILDHYRHPRNYGSIENPDIAQEEDNPLCGDRIQMNIRLNDGVVKEVKFKGEGCAISLASASILTEMIHGKSLEELKALGKDEILKALGITLSPTRLKCGLLSLKVFQAGAYDLEGWPGEEDEEEW